MEFDEKGAATKLGLEDLKVHPIRREHRAAAIEFLRDGRPMRPRAM